MTDLNLSLNLDAVRDLMEARGVDSVSELARRSGVERSLTSKILSGARRASPSQIVAFTRALGCRPRTLAGPPDPEDVLLALAAEVSTPAPAA